MQKYGKARLSDMAMLALTETILLWGRRILVEFHAAHNTH